MVPAISLPIINELLQMKLLTRTTIYYLLFSLPLLLLSGLFLYYSIEKALQHEVDEELENSKVIWIQHLNNLPADKDILELNNPYVQIEKTNVASANNFYSDTLVYEPLEKGTDAYRNLTVFIEHNNQQYKLSFQRSVLEHQAVFKKLIVLMVYVFGGLLLLFLMINFYINKNLWKPFNNSLQKITTLNMQQLQQVHFDKVAISEFNALNNSLNAMTKKMHGDYLSMKTFTQNASHEIQTPLAIIQSKLELLLQDNLLTEQQIVAISSAFEATQRLSKLNQALLLITKIENNQFDASEAISIKAVVEKYQSFFAELLDQKKIALSIIVNADWPLFIHALLADMLISNLFSNAIRYSNQHGSITMAINQDSFEIINTSTMPPITSTRLFHRFIKHDSATGNGLGLAIVKEICDTNNIEIRYTHDNTAHRFKLSAS
ncbi:HAMP domain-containing sensor histidine kinase [soil metagenome]